MSEPVKWFITGWIGLLASINLIYLVFATVSLGSLRCALFGGCSHSDGYLSLGVLLFNVILGSPALAVLVVNCIRALRRPQA
jgi:hypothetical protein